MVFLHFKNISSASSGRPVFSPRSMGPGMGPRVDFPPAFPSTGNLQDICRFSKALVRYPKDMFPQSGFGHVHRQADAINQLQSWYGLCCGINGTPEEQICCAEQAVRVLTLLYILIIGVAFTRLYSQDLLSKLICTSVVIQAENYYFKVLVYEFLATKLNESSNK